MLTRPLDRDRCSQQMTLDQLLRGLAAARIVSNPVGGNVLRYLTFVLLCSIVLHVSPLLRVYRRRIICTESQNTNISSVSTASYVSTLCSRPSDNRACFGRLLSSPKSDRRVCHSCSLLPQPSLAFSLPNSPIPWRPVANLCGLETESLRSFTLLHAQPCNLHPRTDRLTDRPKHGRRICRFP